MERQPPLATLNGLTPRPHEPATLAEGVGQDHGHGHVRVEPDDAPVIIILPDPSAVLASSHCGIVKRVELDRPGPSSIVFLKAW